MNAQKKQKKFYSGKKKKHTIKSQVIVAQKTKKIICTEFAPGKKHDFRLFKESKIFLHPAIKAITDTGFQGLSKIHANTEMPKKATKKNPLSKQEKKMNTCTSRKRIINEHVIRSVKRFKLVADRYRNRRKRFGLRFNFIASVHNFELCL